MIPAPSRVDACLWSVPGHATVVEYSRPVLNDILSQVVDAFDTFSSGGYEVGGVLFGHRDGMTVRVLAFRQLEIVPPRPSFTLSEGDERRLAALIDIPASDHALSGMIAVGWYHSHTRSEVFLSEADLDLFDRFFPDPWKVALVLHPSDLEPVRVGFFFREDDGYIRSDQSYVEFAVDAPPRDRALRVEPLWRSFEEGRQGSPSEDDPEIAAEPEPEEYALPEPQRENLWRRGGKWFLLFLAALAIAAGSVSVFVLRQPPASMGLEVSPVDNELVIRWNPASLGLEDANSATLQIIDGRNRLEIPVLNARNPFKTYRPLTSRVNIRLVANSGWGTRLQEVSTYLAHPDLDKPSPELQAVLKSQQQAQEDVSELEKRLFQGRDEIAVATAQLEQLEQQREQAAADGKRLQEAKRKALAAPKPASAAPRDLPDAPTVAMRQNQPSFNPSLPGTEIRVRPPVDPPKPSPLSPPTVTRSVPPPAATVPPSPRPSTASTASSTFGRVIWTGDWPRDGLLTIQNGKASRGFLSGDLPGVPVRVNVYSGELGANGLKIFTGNQKQVTAKMEAPGAANGWNATQYVFDPKAARDVIVEQLPTAQETRKVVLRAGARRTGVVVIEWQVAAP